MKKCTKCKVEKPFQEFTKQKNGKNGYRSSCKSCCKKYYEKNKDKLKVKYKETAKIYYEKNKDKVKEYKKRYLSKDENKNKQKETAKIYYEKNKEKILEYRNNYNKIYYEKNKEKIEKTAKIYRKNNKEKITKRKTEYNKKRKKIDSIYKFRICVRESILKAFKRGTNQFKKNANTETILGCTTEEFIVYIENKFTKGMSLENHGKWHLDHIIPLASANTEEDIIKLNHYTNFQPLWAKDNISKGCKIIEQQLILI
jgi:hypothetical protein